MKLFTARERKLLIKFFQKDPKYFMALLSHINSKLDDLIEAQDTLLKIMDNILTKRKQIQLTK